MTKEEFKIKHNLTEEDMRNLRRFKQAINSGMVPPEEYLSLMSRMNVNGGPKLAQFIKNNFLEVMDNA